MFNNSNSGMYEELLISLVEQYKELYDLQHPNYDDAQRRNNIWEEIGGITKQSAQDCRDRWKRIRENYRRAKKLRKTRSGQGAKNIKDPKYTKILSFLNPYIDSETDTDSNMPALDSEINTNTDEESFTQASTTSTQSEQTGKKKKSPYQIYKRSRPTEDSTENTSTHSLFQDYINKKYSSQNEPDPVVTFFQNLGQTVKSFPEHTQIRVKREVFKIVSEAEEEVCMMKNHPTTNPQMQINYPSTSHQPRHMSNICFVESRSSTLQNPSDFVDSGSCNIKLARPVVLNTNHLSYSQQPEENSSLTEIEIAPVTVIGHPSRDNQKNSMNEYLNFKK